MLQVTRDQIRSKSMDPTKRELVKHMYEELTKNATRTNVEGAGDCWMLAPFLGNVHSVQCTLVMRTCTEIQMAPA